MTKPTIRSKAGRRPGAKPVRKRTVLRANPLPIATGGGRSERQRGKVRPGQSASAEGFMVAARYVSDGLVDVDAVASEFGMTKTALAKLLGFPEETLQRFSRVTAPKTQRRLRDMLEILTRVKPWAGGMAQAIGWYRGQGIPALGDHTAEALVRNDQADIVRAYLDGVAAGGYA